jgi:hypothetical protein
VVGKLVTTALWPSHESRWRKSERSAGPWLQFRRRLERVTRLELATSSLARRCSTTELHPQFIFENQARNLSRYTSNGVYYARIKVRGKEIWFQSLEWPGLCVFRSASMKMKSSGGGAQSN